VSALKYWVWLSSLRGLSPKSRVALLEQLGGAEAVFFASEEQLKEVEGLKGDELAALRDKSLAPAREILGLCQEKEITILTLQDAAYPRRLTHIYDPPAVLYVKGRLPVVDEEAAIAVVGTREATPYGVKMGLRMGYEITKGGGLVVTGLAAGVDSAAARGALRAGGGCIGVLGTAIDVVYPRSNWALFEDVAAVGALVSEYPPTAPTRRANFPARNRIISGLSVGVTVIEAPAGSGSLITADLAQEQGRDVFAVPGNADSENCQGSNDLIRDGAKSVTRGSDILEEYEGLFPEKLRRLSPAQARIPQEELAPAPETGNEPTPEKARPTAGTLPPETGAGFAKLREASTKKVFDKEKDISYIDLEQQLEQFSENQLKLLAVMTEPSLHVDDIIERSGLSAGEALTELTLLQIAGAVRQEPGKRFSLNIRRK